MLGGCTVVAAGAFAAGVVVGAALLVVAAMLWADPGPWNF